MTVAERRTKLYASLREMKISQMGPLTFEQVVYAESFLKILIAEYQITPLSVACDGADIIFHLHRDKVLRISGVGYGDLSSATRKTYATIFSNLPASGLINLVVTVLGRKINSPTKQLEKPASFTYKIRPLAWGPMVLKVSGYMVEADTIFGSFKIRQKSTSLDSPYFLITPSLKYSTKEEFLSLSDAQCRAENIYVTMLEDRVLIKTPGMSV